MKYPMDRLVTTTVASFHIGFLAAMFYPSWGNLEFAASVWFAGSCLGTGVCYHRLLTHNGFKTYKWVEYTLAVIGCVPLQGDPARWVSVHRMHHRHTEKSGLDPHTPRDGKWWSHLLWLTHPNPETERKDLSWKWANDLMRQSFYRKLKKVFWLPTTMWGLGCLYFGGIQAMLWGVMVPITFSWHATWLVNSATHLWGRQRFQTGDDSRNNWWVALLTFGEGWHNNHHHDPSRARHGIRWWEVDVNFFVITLLEVFALAWDVKSKAVHTAAP